jgi:hypothetical protein
MPSKTHVMHGRDHLPNGADPIPGLQLPTASYPDTILAHPCLVHYWPADETSGNLVDRKGSLNLAVSTASVGGTTYPQYGAAGPLAGSPEETAVVNAGNYGASGHSNRFQTDSFADTFPSGFTVEAWAYLTSYGTADTSELFDNDGLFIDFFSRKLQAKVAAVTVADPADLPLNSWQYIVARHNGTTLALFRNGTLVGSAASTAAAWGSHLAFMNVAYTGGSSWSPWNGSACQFAVYNCPLTDAEIGNHLEIATTPGGGGGGVVWEDVGVTAATSRFLPLTTTNTAGDDVLVFDDDHSLVPTAVPF